MKRLRIIAGVIAAVGAGGCGSDAPVEIYSDIFQYVVKQITVPETAGHAQMLARDINGNGQKTNALGRFLAVVNTMSIPNGCEQTVNNSINSGKTLLLLEVKTNLAAADTAARVQMMMGTDLNNDTTDNFSGKAQLAPQAAPQAALDGSLVGTQLRAGRGAGILPLAPGGTPKVLQMTLALLESTFAPDKLDDGVLSGAVTWDQFEQALLPGFASTLDCVVKNPIGGGG